VKALVPVVEEDGNGSKGKGTFCRHLESAAEMLWKGLLVLRL
jgi:hypothetical protein